MSRGFFITFEGGEGAGKSTQVRRLADHLRALGHDPVLTREPGGSPGAEAIRDIVLNGPPERWSPVTEALLMYAARRDHIERVIRPALQSGKVVICDRFADSTRAYQGAGGQVDARLIDTLEACVLEDLKPDLTLILDLPVEKGLSRALSRGGGEDRFEAKGAAFHQRLRQAFLDIAAADPARCLVLAADRTPEAVGADIIAAVGQRIELADV